MIFIFEKCILSKYDSVYVLALIYKYKGNNQKVTKQRSYLYYEPHDNL